MRILVNRNSMERRARLRESSLCRARGLADPLKGGRKKGARRVSSASPTAVLRQFVDQVPQVIDVSLFGVRLADRHADEPFVVDL